MSQVGFWPIEKRCDSTLYKCESVIVDGQPVENFSVITLAGILMFSMFVLPMLLRPIDFIFNI